MLHLVGLSILLYLIDDVRTNKNQVCYVLCGMTLCRHLPTFRIFVLCPDLWQSSTRGTTFFLNVSNCSPRQYHVTSSFWNAMTALLLAKGVNCSASHHVISFLTFAFILSVVSASLWLFFRRVHKIAKSDCQLRHVCLSVCPSVRPSVRMKRLCCSHLTDFREISYLSVFSKIFWGKFTFHKNLTKITGNLHEDLRTFVLISRWILFRIRNVSDQICIKNRNTFFASKYVFPDNRYVYDIMWKYIVERGRAQMAIWCMRIACWIPKARPVFRYFTPLGPRNFCAPPPPYLFVFSYVQLSNSLSSF